MPHVMEKNQFFAFFICLLVFPLFGENFDYHREESPAISWNGLALYDARMLGAGGVSFFSAPPFEAISNPARTSGIDKPVIGGSLEIMNFMAFQYWGVNEGILKAPEGLSDTGFRFSGFCIALPIKSFSISLGWYASDILRFPDFNHQEYYWGYSGEYDGQVNNYFLAAAFNLGKGFHIGFKLEYANGTRSIDMTEYYYYDGGYFSSLKQQELHQSHLFQPSLGFWYPISKRWEIGVVLDYPLYGKVDRTVTRSFENNFPSPSIEQKQTGTDDFLSPGKILLGASFLPLDSRVGDSGKSITIAADALYVFWSEYRYLFFDEEIERDMRDTLIFSLGMEFASFHKKYDYFLRLGYRLDPQPIREPTVTLHGFSGGLGFRWERLSGDLGVVYYTGSVNDFRQNHLLMCCSFVFRLKGE